MIKRLIQPIFVVFLVFFIISCTKDVPKTFSISGHISPASVDYVILQKEVDIERKIIEVIDTIEIDNQGNFKASFTTEPYLYSLVFPNKKSVGLAINENQDIAITIEGYDTENVSFSITGL